MTKPRLESIDFVRGLIMVIMALDHVRDFFYTHTIDPTKLDETSPGLFFTRWITHFCAPTFLLLAGVGIALSRQRGKTGNALSAFLFTRGVWLIFLEWVVVRTLGWAWNLDFNYLPCWVIWTLGWSMIVLSGLVRFPTWVPVTLGLALIAGHHLLDHIKAEHMGPMRVLWYFLHDPKDLVLHQAQGWIPQDEVKDYRGFTLGAGYPLIPWIGVMSVGYGLGMIYAWDAHRRRRFLIVLGLACVCCFVLLRYSNLYGETRPWSQQSTAWWTLISFLNCTKQPPSLCFLLMTLGPVLLLLTWCDRGMGPWASSIITFGKVPLFYYLLHLPLIHGFCMLAAWWQLGAFPTWLLTNPPLADMPPEFGFPLSFSYAIWLLIVILLYPLCAWYAAVKARYRSPWLSYL